MQTQCTHAVGKGRTVKVIFEQIVCSIIRTTNGLIFYKEITFISRAIPISAKGSANYE